jgi:hypothetical protein
MPCRKCAKDSVKIANGNDCQLNQEKLDEKKDGAFFRKVWDDDLGDYTCNKCQHDYGSHTSGAPDAKQGGGNTIGKLVCDVCLFVSCVTDVCIM